MLRLPAVLAALLALVLVVAGCGGSGDSGSSESGGTTAGTTTAPLTNDEFGTAGSAICKRSIAEIEKGFEEFAKEENLGKGTVPDKKQQAEVVEQILAPAIADQVKQIRALDAPGVDEEAVKKFLAGIEAELKKAKAEPISLITPAAFQKSREEGAEIGMPGCPAG